jgi:hypothetical protein
LGVSRSPESAETSKSNATIPAVTMNHVRRQMGIARR